MKYYLNGEEVTSREYLQWQKEYCFLSGMLPDIEIKEVDTEHDGWFKRLLKKGEKNGLI